MIKKIPVSELRLGMFIHDLNIGWMAHAFLRNRFMLKRDQDLQRIIESGLSEVFIDTLKGLDLPGAPTEAEAEAEMFREAYEREHPPTLTRAILLERLEAKRKAKGE